MSRFNSSKAEPVPSVVLVSKVERDRRAEQIRDKMAQSALRQLPWVPIAIGASAAWALFLGVMGFLSMNQGPAPEPPVVRIRAVDGPLAGGAVPQAPVAAAPKLNAVPAPAEKPKKLIAADELDAKQEQNDNGLFADCQQTGTLVRFMKAPPEAFKRAREEKKLVMMVHLSGNLEDPGFT